MLYIFISYPLFVTAQTFDIFIANRQLISSTTMEFDVFIKNNGSTLPWGFKLFQAGYQFNPSFVNGGTLSGSYVSGSSELESSFGKTWGFSFNNTYKVLNQSSNIGSLCPGAIISTLPRKIGRFRITNTVNWGCADDSIRFKTSGSGYLLLAVAKYNSIDCTDRGSTLISSSATPYIVNPSSSVLNISLQISAASSPCDALKKINVDATGGLSPYTGTGIFTRSSGTYLFSVTDSRGCSANSSIDIPYLPLPTIFFDIACNYYVLPWLDTAKVTGAYLHTYLTSLGCDSIVTANIVIHNSSTSNSYDTIFDDRLPYIWNGISCNAAGIYNKSLSNVFGCDSSATLLLTVLKKADSCKTPTILSNVTGNIICSGASVVLSVQGSLKSGAVWNWYKEGCGIGSILDTGKTINITPISSALYFVRSMGGICGLTPCGSILINIKTQPAVSDSIVGYTSGLCNAHQVNYLTNTIADAASYIWTVPLGAEITAGQGTNSLWVNFSNQLSAASNICVKTSNSCGASSLRCNSISLKPSITNSINGPSSMMKGQVAPFSISPVFGASGYLWTVPSGWKIVSGQGTVSVLIKAGNTNGAIKLSASNSCGSSSLVSKSVSILAGRSTYVNEFDELKIGPIPSNDILFLDAGLLKPRLIELLDMFGRIVYRSVWTQKIILSDFAPGIYHIRIYFGKDILVKVIEIVR